MSRQYMFIHYMLIHIYFGGGRFVETIFLRRDVGLYIVYNTLLVAAWKNTL